MKSPSVLIADLNNFAMYPTLSVGYLAAICRQHSMNVSVFSPLFIGVRGIAREKPENSLSLLAAKLNFRTAQSRHQPVRELRRWIGSNVRSPVSRQQRKVLAGFEQRLHQDDPDIVLISSYLMYRELTASICELCAENNVPVIVGGPYFAQREVIDAWIDIEGMSALAAGEVELQLPEIIHAILDEEDPTNFTGMAVPNGSGSFRGRIAPPLRELDRLPFPDFSDFPWSLYDTRIVPILTGRGCGWGACTFCSDITSTAGRTYRSRSPKNVLNEIAHIHQTHGVTKFVFTDLKLNSNPDMWQAILEEMQTLVPGAEWIASVHVEIKDNHTLTGEQLQAAAESGCVRLTTGLESGSQRMLNRMKKGTSIARESQYLNNATAAGISTRCTMIAGYPGEEADDVQASADFVRAHADVIDRVKLCNFSLIVGTGVDRMRQRDDVQQTRVVNASADESGSSTAIATRSIAVEDVTPHYALAQLDYFAAQTTRPGYCKAMLDLITAVHEVNRQPLMEKAAAFEGVM